jgi:hypothetical protein
MFLPRQVQQICRQFFLRWTARRQTCRRPPASTASSPAALPIGPIPTRSSQELKRKKPRKNRTPQILYFYRLFTNSFFIFNPRRNSKSGRKSCTENG